MAAVVVRRLNDATKERLRARASSRGRSLESEIRDILENASQNEPDAGGQGAPAEMGFGTLMAERFGKRGLTPYEKRRFERAADELRNRSMMSIPDFEE